MELQQSTPARRKTGCAFLRQILHALRAPPKGLMMTSRLVGRCVSVLMIMLIRIAHSCTSSALCITRCSNCTPAPTWSQTRLTYLLDYFCQQYIPNLISLLAASILKECG